MRASVRKTRNAKSTIGAMIGFPRLILTEPGFETLKEADMNIQVSKALQLPLLGGGIVAVLVSGIAIAFLAISAQGFSGASVAAQPPEAAEAPAVAAPVARAYRCAECGVIESTRKIGTPDEKTGVKASGRMAAGSRGEIEAKPLQNYEITIRLRDGSMRVITDAKPAIWRRGEPVTIIAGVD